MERGHKRFRLAMVLMSLSACGINVSYAAQPIELSHQKLSSLQALGMLSTRDVNNATYSKELNRSFDFKNNLHIRLQQMYSGYRVFGADFVLHIPNGNKNMSLVDVANQKTASMNGTIYSDLSKDLSTVSIKTLMTKQSNLMQKTQNDYLHAVQNKFEISNANSELLIYIDDQQKAHWAFQFTFDAKSANENHLPSKPVFIVDAITGQIYEKWDNIQTIDKTAESGGGFGGNLKMGKLVYDGLQGNLPKLNISRDGSLCTLENTDVVVKKYGSNKLMSFNCDAIDPEHNNVYWWGDQDAVNGGYSPSDDALFGGAVIKDMYSKWYGIPVLVDKSSGKPMMLTMVVHDPIDNAYWDGTKMTFGDGLSMFYPLTSLGVAAHEISHGFTEQHSGLIYRGQSGGMNESFSDIAAQAAEWYAYGKNSWQIGPEIFKQENEALRYMDQPSKDCHGRDPGDWCSIDTADQYRGGIDVHFSSGVYNHFFYLLGTSEGWDTKKAFDVMIQANMHYWTAKSTFKDAACGVIKATKDYNYDVTPVRDAFTKVAIDTSTCA